MEYTNFSVEKDPNGIVLLTANRPEKMNAMNTLAWQELLSFFTAADTDDSIRAIIITGAGDKAFIAGADISALGSKKPAAMLNSVSGKVTSAIENCSKPVIAAVNGYALGGGCEVAIACDIRLVTDTAQFGLPEPAIGVLPAAGGTQRLSRLIGVGRAKEVILLGRRIKAEEAVSCGLAWRIVAKEELIPEAKKAAASILEKSPVSISMCKRLIKASMTSDYDSGIYMELLAMAVTCGTEDMHEGVNSFLEKRKPEFTGR